VLVREAIRKLQLRHNFRVMEKETAVLTTTAQTRVLTTLPTDWKEWRGLPYMIDQNGVIRELAVAPNRAAVLREFRDSRGGEADADDIDGRPRVLLISEPTNEAGAANIEVYPYSDSLSLYTTAPAGEYRIVIPYWRYLTALSLDADTNWFTVNADEWIVRMGTSEGFFMDHDEERGTIWAQRAAEKWSDVLGRDKTQRLSFVRELVPSPDAGGPRVRFAP
jgi:hypothetical protein